MRSEGARVARGVLPLREGGVERERRRGLAAVLLPRSAELALGPRGGEGAGGERRGAARRGLKLRLGAVAALDRDHGRRGERERWPRPAAGVAAAVAVPRRRALLVSLLEADRAGERALDVKASLVRLRHGRGAAQMHFRFVGGKRRQWWRKGRHAPRPGA